MKENLTQNYSTWGDKLLQHTDVLYSIQKKRKFIPITIQVSLTEACNSNCSFCSVKNRPINSYIPFKKLDKMLSSFKILGAKSVEITGGGNPLLYYDKESKKDINDVIKLVSNLGLDLGIITNHYTLKKLNKSLYKYINWIRISLTMLDQGIEPTNYDFNNFPISKLGFSYIIYNDNPTNTFIKIAKLVELYPEIKFVRFAGDCLIKGNNALVKEKYTSFLQVIDKNNKFFIKDIDNDDNPFNDGCYVGAIRPYIAPHPNGGDYQIYICTSYVLNKRTYDLDYSLGSIDNVIEIWNKMNKSFRENKFLYEVNYNSGCAWESNCKYCFYKFNNKLLHTVSNEMPDKNFP